MFLALITDEYTQDPATAFELGRRWGIQHYEIRQAYRFRAPVGPGWLAERVAAAVRDYGVTITGISPGLFKPTMRIDGATVPLSCGTPGEVRRHLDELLPGFFAFAERLGTRNVTVFALPKDGAAGEGAEAIPPIVIDSLGEAAQAALKRGFQLLLENVSSSYADSADNTLAILRGVNSPALQLTWDPGNVAVRGLGQDPVGRDYTLLKGYVKNLHVKDVAFRDGQGIWTMLGEGVVNWPRQFRLLRQDGYAGPVTLEPHMTFQAGAKDLVAFMERLLARVRQYLSDA